MKKIFTLIITCASLFVNAQSPTTSPNAPTEDAAGVVSIYSDTYTDVAGTNFFPNWGQTTTYSEFDLSGDKMIQYSNLNYQGIEFGSDVNAAIKTTLHLDIWTSNLSTLEVYLISRTTGEKKVSVNLTANQWTTKDIDLKEYTDQGLSVGDIFQLKFVGVGSTGTIFLDNIYFYGSSGVSNPASSASVPQQRASRVSSIFSDAYTDLAGVNFFPNWGQSTQFDYFDLNGDSMIKYSNLNYQGIEFGSQVDASGKDYMHIDVYTPDVSNLEIYCISATNGEKFVTKALTADQWNSIDILVSDFTDQGLSVSDLIQFKFVDPDGNAGTIFIDNIYFYENVPTPMVAADEPTENEDRVVSIYSESYTNVSGTNYFPNWGQTTQFDEYSIEEDSMLKYSKLNYQGIEFGSDVDASTLDTLHMDVWSPDAASIDVFCISRGSGEKKVTASLTAGEWNSVNIAMSEYTSQGLSVNDLFQFKFVDPSNNGIIYLDNIFFFARATENVTNISFDELSIYPNPAKDVLTINVNTNGDIIRTLKLTNLYGQEIITRKINSTSINKTLSLNDLNAGVYFINLTTETGIYTHKVILK